MRFEHAAELHKPLVVKLDEGTYHWCRCGQTNTPPFCDGAHENFGATPLEFKVDGTKELSICTCGLTKNPPFCDGSHVNY